MNFAEYLDSVENTENEKLIFEHMAKEIPDLEKAVKEAPVLKKVKLINAIMTLGQSESIAQFKETEAYDYLESWDIDVTNLEKGQFNIYPGPEARSKIAKIALCVGVTILLLILWRCRRKK